MPKKKQDVAKETKKPTNLKSSKKTQEIKNTKDIEYKQEEIREFFAREYSTPGPSVLNLVIKKIFLALGFIIFLGIGAGYFLLYTSGGNHLLKSYAQSRLDKMHLNLELKNLMLKIGSIDANLIYDNKLEIRVFGDFNLFSQKMKLKLEGKSRSWQYPFSIQGSVSGDLKNVIFNLTSNIAQSKTHIIAEVSDYSLQRLFVDVKNMVLEEFLPLFVENNAMGGMVNFAFYGNVQTSGSFELDIKNLRTLRRLTHFSFFNQILKHSASGNIKGKLEGRNITQGSGSIASSAYQIDFSNIIGDFSKIKWDYLVRIPSLKMLNPSIRNDFLVEIGGMGSYDEKWQLSFASESFDGQITGEMLNQKLNLNFNDSNATKLLAFLRLPQEIDATFSGKLDYDLAEHTGLLTTQVGSLKIRHNKFFNLIRQYSGFDVQKEEFQPFSFVLDIMGYKGVARFSIEGERFGLESKDFKINFYELGIDAPLSVNVQLDENKRVGLNLYLEGNIHAPKTVFDLREILRLDKSILKNLKAF